MDDTGPKQMNIKNIGPLYCLLILIFAGGCSGPDQSTPPKPSNKDKPALERLEVRFESVDARETFFDGMRAERNLPQGIMWIVGSVSWSDVIIDSQNPTLNASLRKCDLNNDLFISETEAHTYLKAHSP